MERNPKRAWRRKQIKRKWHKRLRDFYFYSAYSHNDFHGVKKFKSWKELKSLDWANIYKPRVLHVVVGCVRILITIVLIIRRSQKEL